MADPVPSILDLKRDLVERLWPGDAAFSADGHRVELVARIESGLRVGSFAVVEPDAGTSGALVVQVRGVHLVERDGPQLDVEFSEGALGAHIGTAAVRPVVRTVAGDAVVLGTLDGPRFAAAPSSTPFGERAVRPAGPDEVAAVAEGLIGDDPSIEIGVRRDEPGVPARLRSKGFARHTFMCGQSGSGKTYTTGALFERLLAATTLPLVMLDPNSDHVHLGELRDADDRSDLARRFGAVAPTVRVARARGLEASYTLCADFSDLDLDAQALVLRLHPVADLDEFDTLARITATLTAPYSIHDVVAAAHRAHDDPVAARLARRITNLGVDGWDVWRRAGETPISAVDLPSQRCVVIDLGSLTRPDERTAVALAVLSNRWRRRAERNPVLIAIDEAHNVVPAQTDDPLLAASAATGVLIAGEGRKFGLHLFVATQRPAKVHPNVVSQCDNLVLMRMNGAADIEALASSFSHVPEPLLREALGFGLGQALFAGPITPVPLIAQVGTRVTAEGGGDVPTDWARPPT